MRRSLAALAEALARREDPEAARRTIEARLPDQELREAILNQMVEDIVAAHQINPASWETTLVSSGFTLNVGRVWMFSPARWRKWNFPILIDQRLLDGETQRLLEQDGLLQCESGSLFNARWVCVPPERYRELFPRIREAHQAIIPDAARQHKRTPYYIHHSPGVPRYLRLALGRDVPDPAYAAPAPARSQGSQRLLPRQQESQWG